MKTERRHELQHNELADLVISGVESVKPYLQVILGGILALVVVVGVYRYWSENSKTDHRLAWDTYLQATANGDQQLLNQVVEQHPGSQAATWSRLSLGDMHLQRGIDQLFVNRADAKDELRKAETNYLEARQGAKDALLEQRVTLGLARTYESLVELDKARAEYERLKTKWPKCVFTPLAEQRLNDLATLPTREFYDWFVKNEPKSSIDGASGIQPPFNLDNLPSDPPVKVDPNPNLNLNSPGTGTTTPSSEGAPPTSTEKPSSPGTQPPTDAPPSGEKPASSDKPADSGTKPNPGEQPGNSEKPATTPSSEKPADQPAGNQKTSGTDQPQGAVKPAEPSVGDKPSSSGEPAAPADPAKPATPSQP